ncbi:MAG: MEKHLA domain-containing protein [Candidatus Peregrinibacteria bacterium]|nr:MEKHLA domain-containing protein [Candidatus Peregrinibacteria bacterium]
MKTSAAEFHQWSALPESTKGFTIDQTRLMTESLFRLSGQNIIHNWRRLSPVGLAEKAFEMRRVLVSHGTESDPILNYGNYEALKLWQLSWEELTKMPSRKTAEPDQREERARFLAEVEKKGFVDDYSGVRISSRGDRFRIKNALVWRLEDETGPKGMAAMFDDIEYL